MVKPLFNLTEKEYRLERKAWKLRDKISLITAQLNIQPDHDDKGHFYTFNGKRYPSVTGRLQLLKDPSLANWKMNRALDYMFQHFPEITNENLVQHLENAKLLPQTEFETAGSIGTAVHGWREVWMNDILANGYDPKTIPAYNPNADPQVISGCRAFQKFMAETGYMPIACELNLADPTLQTGGSGDDIGILNGEVGFMDVKTSNIGDKDAYFYQVALYVYMFEKLYKVKTKWHKILHLSKTDGTYKLIDIPDIRKRIKEAKQIIKVDQFLQDLKVEKKKTPIVI